MLTVGRLSATKRLPLLIDAISMLRDQGAKVRLTVVGGGSLESQLHRLVSEKGLGEAVTLLGRQGMEDMPDVYRQHDLYVSASAQEGMSNAMLEAMASGLPIVTTRCEGVDELISNNGVVVEGSAPAALAQAIRELVANPRRCQAMSLAARRRAEQLSWDVVAESYLQLYAKVK